MKTDARRTARRWTGSGREMVRIYELGLGESRHVSAKARDMIIRERV